MPRATNAVESRSERKHRAILEAASESFLAQGFLGTNMDVIAEEAKTSKQTVYKHFGSKEALFIEIVSSITDTAGDRISDVRPEITDGARAEDLLQSYAERQLITVLDPKVLQLRRIVVGEAGRFPELARVLYERGPLRAIADLTSFLEELRDHRLVVIDNPATAAVQFNWLIMADPLTRATFLGDDAIPSRAQLRRHVAESVRLFLAAYGTDDSTDRRPNGRNRSRRAEAAS